MRHVGLLHPKKPGHLLMIVTWLYPFDATGDEKNDEEVGILRFPTELIKVTYAGLWFHPSRTIAVLVSAPDTEGVQVRVRF